MSGGHIEGNILVPFLSYMKRGKSHQPTEWADDIHRFLKGKHFQRIAQDRKELKGLQETFALYERRNNIISDYLILD